MNQPEPRLIRTAYDAEKAARDWMRYWGFLDAHTFPGGGPDEGVDVRSSGAVAQVKATVGAAGRPIIQQIYGIAELEDVQALVFSLGGYTDEAVEWANRAGVALFQFDLTGEPKPVNGHAHELQLAADGIEPMTKDRLEEMIGALELGEALVGTPHNPHDKAQWRIERTATGYRSFAPPNEKGEEWDRLSNARGASIGRMMEGVMDAINAAQNAGRLPTDLPDTSRPRSEQDELQRRMDELAAQGAVGSMRGHPMLDDKSPFVAAFGMVRHLEKIGFGNLADFKIEIIEAPNS